MGFTHRANDCLLCENRAYETIHICVCVCNVCTVCNAYVCMYVCVCLYVCMYLCVYIYIYACMYACMYVDTGRFNEVNAINWERCQ